MENVHLDVISKVKLSDKKEIQTFNWMEGIPSLSRKKVSHLMYYSKVSYFSWFTSQSKNWISIISEESQKKNFIQWVLCMKWPQDLFKGFPFNLLFIMFWTTMSRKTPPPRLCQRLPCGSLIFNYCQMKFSVIY